jgi:serine/alanine adding enzyme
MSSLELIDNVANINQLMVDSNGINGSNVFHAKQMADIKKSQGWNPCYLKFKDGELTYIFLVLTKRVPILGSIGYIARGPNVEDNKLSELIRSLSSWASDNNLFLLKIEPNINESKLLKLKDEFNLKQAKSIQTNSSTIIIDISAAENELLNSFKQKTRYNIRLSARKGVKVNTIDLTDQNMEIMYQMMLQMSHRSGAAIKSREYLFSYWQAFVKAGDGAMFFAEDESREVLAGAFVQFLGDQALYKDGGSTRKKSNLMAPYLLQWEIIRWLKLKGVVYYDMHGSTPSKLEDDQSHSFYSVTKFKQGFNKQITDWAGVWDLPIRGLKYLLWARFGNLYLKYYYLTNNKQTFY